MKSAPQARQKGGEEDVCDERHDGDVHIRGVEVVAGRKKVVAVGIVVRVLGDARGPLFTGPGLVAPGKEDEENFTEDVRGGDVEVVF